MKNKRKTFKIQNKAKFGQVGSGSGGGGGHTQIDPPAKKFK